MNLILYFWLIFSRRIPLFPIISRLIEHFVYVEIPALRDCQMAYLNFEASLWERHFDKSNRFKCLSFGKFNAIYS